MADDASAGDVCIFVRSASAPRGLEAKMSDCRGIMCVFRVGMVGLDANDVERRRRVSDHMTMAHQSDSSAEAKDLKEIRVFCSRHIHKMLRTAVRSMATSARQSLTIGLIPADGIGREVIPVCAVRGSIIL
jgi:hypothetical protein